MGQNPNGESSQKRKYFQPILTDVLAPTAGLMRCCGQNSRRALQATESLKKGKPWPFFRKPAVIIKPKEDSNEWEEQDSNLRRHSQQIYSLSRLTASVPSRIFISIVLWSYSWSAKTRASGGARTHDLRFTKPLLSQLSYAGQLFKARTI